MRSSMAAMAILAAFLVQALPATPSGDDASVLVARLEHIDARLAGAVAAVRPGGLPKGFAGTIRSIDHDVANLGHALPDLGKGPARGSVVYYGLRRADTKLALARKHIRFDQPGSAGAVRSAGADLVVVAQELARNADLKRLSEGFGGLAERTRTSAGSDAKVRALMMGKDSLLKALPTLAGVRFATFYVQSGVLHARLGHALRTTAHNEPERVLNDLLGARQATRSLEAAFRGRS